MSLQAISIPAKTTTPKGLIVILHGWGANAQDVAALSSFLELPDYHFLFPNAPFPSTYAPTGRVWYNFPDNYAFLSRPEFYDQPELVESRQQLTEWLFSLEEMTQIPLSKTVLGGFSQGGAMTMDVGLTLPLAALMVLSGYLHAPVRVAEQASPASASTSSSSPPILMVHGRQDQVVPLTAAQQARDGLLGLKRSVDYHELAIGHEIQPSVLRLMQSFIEERVFLLNSSA
jgi:phospholipase/carboxylesterase